MQLFSPDFNIALKIYSDVTVIIGDRVQFDGFGLTGKVRGHVRVIEDPDKPTTGSGELADQ